jgi:PhnB protein
MASVSLNPYLFFNGNAREAMEFYKGIFGGELNISNFEDFNSDVPGMEEMKGKVMHAMLDGEVKLMASDSRQASDKMAKVEFSISGDDEAKLKSYFEKLSAGGTVKMPLEKQAWGDLYGQLQDEYGVDWMINISQPKQ